MKGIFAVANLFNSQSESIAFEAKQDSQANLGGFRFSLIGDSGFAAVDRARAAT